MKQVVWRWGCLLLGAAFVFAGCDRFKRKHIPVEQVEELGYPRCAGAVPPEGTTVAQQHLRSGPTHIDPTIVERFRIRERGCVIALEVRQEWPLGTADLEVLYDRKLRPLRIWKRMTLPGIERAKERAETTRYELRTEPVSIKRRTSEGKVERELLKGGRPTAVIGPGRGLISMWARRAKLEVGQKVRQLAIDVRGLEKIQLVTLMREPDMKHPELGLVRVYTFYGRETVFANQDDVIVGDLAGLRPDALLDTAPPPALPLYGPLDPVSTP